MALLLDLGALSESYATVDVDLLPQSSESTRILTDLVIILAALLALASEVLIGF